MAPALSKWYETPYFQEVTISVIWIILIIPSLELYDKIAVSLPFRDVFGENISAIRLEDLKELYPEGFDTYRFQYLLHDTLRKEERRIDVIQTLISIFPNGIMKVVDDKGDTPFLLACQYSSVEVVEYLVGIDSDLLGSRDNKGNTALHYACRGKNYKVAKYLYRYSGLVTKRNAKGYLPVYLLCGIDKDLLHTTSGGGWQSFFTFYSRSTSRVKYGSDEYYANNKKKLKLSTQFFPIPSVEREHLETIWRLFLAYPEDMS